MLSLLALFLLPGLCAASPAPAADAPEAPLFSVGIVTDVHYSNRKEPANNRYYGASKRKLEEAVATFNDAHVDWVVSLGDLIDCEIDSYADIAPILGSAAAPVLKIAGNHDFPVPFDEERQRVFSRTMGLDRPYFSVVRAGFRLLFLDGNEVSIYAHAEGSPQHAAGEKMLAELTAEGASNARHYNGALGGEQLAWLMRELEEATAARQQVVCFCHMPALPLLGRYTLWNNLSVAALLEAAPCVKAYLSGHHHPGGWGTYGNVHYVTFQGMIEGPDNHYAIVEVYPEKLVIRGFGAEKSRTLEFLR